MNVYNLGDEQVSELLGLPETGMGFQLVEATFWGERKQFLIFNGYRAVDLSPLGLDFTADPSAIERNEARIIEALKESVTTTYVATPGPHSFKLLGNRVAAVPPAAAPS